MAAQLIRAHAVIGSSSVPPSEDLAATTTQTRVPLRTSPASIAATRVMLLAFATSRETSWHQEGESVDNPFATAAESFYDKVNLAVSGADRETDFSLLWSQLIKHDAEARQAYAAGEQ
jgi:hypothetical protein